MRRVDKLGRIVIPRQLREKYGLCEGAEIEFIEVADGVTVRSAEPICKICRKRIADAASLPLCESCIAEVIKKHSQS